MPLLAALLFATAVQAQTITFDQLPEAKGVVKNSIPHFIGCDGESVVLIQRSGRLKNRLELVKYTLGLKEQCRAGLDGGEDYRCYGGFINDGHIDLLYSTFIGEGMRVYRDRRSLARRATAFISAMPCRPMGNCWQVFLWPTARRRARR